MTAADHPHHFKAHHELLINLLLLILIVVADKGRIAEDVRAFATRKQLIPIHLEGIVMQNMRAVPQRQS